MNGSINKLGKPHQSGEILAASPMARIIHSPTRIQAEGQPPKIIEEFFGRVNSGTSALSIARMVSPSGWSSRHRLLRLMSLRLSSADNSKSRDVTLCIKYRRARQSGSVLASGFVTALLVQKVPNI